MPQEVDELVDIRAQLLSHAIKWAAGADQDAQTRLYDAWDDQLDLQLTGLDFEAADRIIFGALVRLAAAYLAAKHCDQCRDGWATRLCLLMSELSKRFAAQDAAEGVLSDATIN